MNDSLSADNCSSLEDKMIKNVMTVSDNEAAAELFKIWNQIQKNNCAEVKVMSYCSTFVQQPKSEYSVD